MPDLTVEPARIDRARHALPPGYEVAPYTGAPTPLAVWGLAGPVEAQPAQCVELAAPPDMRAEILNAVADYCGFGS